jgi:hypothetical protein
MRELILSCIRCRPTSLADGNAQEVPTEVRAGTIAEPIGGSAGRGPHQVIQPGHRSAGRQCPADAEGARWWGNQPRGSGRWYRVLGTDKPSGPLLIDSVA